MRLRLKVFARCHFPGLCGVMFAGLLLAGCSKEAKVAKHVDRADGYYAEGEYDKARIEYLNAAQLQPTNAHVVAQLGNIFFEGGIVLQASAAIDQALKLGATDARLHTRRGAILAARNQLPAARLAAQQALSMDPVQADAVLLLADLAVDPAGAAEFRATIKQLRDTHGDAPIYGVAEAALLLRERNFDAAIALLQPALQAEPSAAAAYYVLGGVHLTRTNVSDALAALGRAAELSPLRSSRQLRYADVLLQTGATNEGRAHLDKVAAAAPDFVPVRLRKAQLAFADRDYPAAEVEIAAILNRDQLNIEARQLQAQWFLANKQPARAEALMNELVRQFPGVVQLHYQAGLASLANLNNNQAILHLEKAFELNPTSPDIVLLRGRLKLARGEAGEVVDSARALLQKFPDARPAYLLLGDALVASDKAPEALAVYQEYSQRFPTDPVGLHLVGMVQARNKDMDAARASFEAALARRADYLPSIERLVVLDLVAGQPAPAEARLKGFLNTNPKSNEGRLMLASVQLAAGQSELAEQGLRQLIEDEPSLERAYLQLAEVLIKARREDEAIKQLDDLLARKPADVRALMLLGVLHTQKEDYLKAADQYEKLLKVDPSSAAACNNLAYLYSEKLKNLDRAYELARKSREIKPKDPRVADTLGWIMYLRGEYPDALVLLLESAQELPTYGEVQYHVGMAHYAMGHASPARAALDAALKLGKDEVWMQMVRDTLLVLDTGGPASADPATLQRLQAMLKQRPQDVLLLTRIGRAQEAAGKIDEALASYRQAGALNPRAVAPMIGLASATLAAGKPGEALTVARRARDLTRNDQTATLQLSEIAGRAGDHAWSYALLQEVAASSPTDHQLQFALGEGAVAVGQLEAARVAFEKAAASPELGAASRARLQLVNAASILPTDPLPAGVGDLIQAAPRNDVLAGYLKARVAAAAGNSDEARTQLTSLLSKFPRFTPAMRSLAVALAAAGQHAEAEKWARQAREANANDALMAKVLGQAALARNDFGYAGTMLQEATRTLASDGEAFLLLGQARARASQVADARQALNKALSLPLSDAQKDSARQLLQQMGAQ